MHSMWTRHSNYNPMRQFWDATLTQDVWPAVWGWRLLKREMFRLQFWDGAFLFAIRILQYQFQLPF